MIKNIPMKRFAKIDEISELVFIWDRVKINLSLVNKYLLMEDIPLFKDL